MRFFLSLPTSCPTAKSSGYCLESLMRREHGWVHVACHREIGGRKFRAMSPSKEFLLHLRFVVARRGQVETENSRQKHEQLAESERRARQEAEAKLGHDRRHQARKVRAAGEILFHLDLVTAAARSDSSSSDAPVHPGAAPLELELSSHAWGTNIRRQTDILCSLYICF